MGRVRGLIQGLGATGFRCLPAVIKSNMKPTGGQKRRRWLTGGLGTSEDLPPRTQGDRASPEGTAPCQLDSPQLMSPCCGAGLGQRKQRWACIFNYIPTSQILPLSPQGLYLGEGENHSWFFKGSSAHPPHFLVLDIETGLLFRSF